MTRQAVGRTLRRHGRQPWLIAWLAAAAATGVAHAQVGSQLCQAPGSCCPSTVVPAGVTGLPAARAEWLLRDRYGLRQVAQMRRPHDRMAAGTVFWALPRPGSAVCLDTPVTLFVAEAPPPEPPACPKPPSPNLPDTVGRRLDEALLAFRGMPVRVRVQPLCGADPDPATSRVVAQRQLAGLPSGAEAAIELKTEHDAALPPLRGLAASEAALRLQTSSRLGWTLCALSDDARCGHVAPDDVLVALDRVDRRSCRIDAEFRPGSPPNGGGSDVVPLAGGAALLAGTSALAGMKLAQVRGSGAPAAPAPSTPNRPTAPLRLRVRRDMDA